MFYIHCWVKPGGALNVLTHLISRYGWSDQTRIFALYSDRDFLIVDMHKIPIITALPYWVNRLFRRVDTTKPRYIYSIMDYRNLFVFYPTLTRYLSHQIDIYIRRTSQTACVISSYAIAKNVSLPAGVHTTLYLHQPMHYIWTLYDQYISYMYGRKKQIYIYMTPILRRRDSQPRYYDVVYTNSLSTQTQARSIYHIAHSIVQHCPIDKFFWDYPLQPSKGYYIYVGRVTKMFKQLDVLIALCNKHQCEFLILGDGPDMHDLRRVAGSTIHFLGRVGDKEKVPLIAGAKGFLNLAYESFGIVTIEALLLGVPVFGNIQGGTGELVGKNMGLTTDVRDDRVLEQAFVKFIHTDHDRTYIQSTARNTFLPQQQWWEEKI